MSLRCRGPACAADDRHDTVSRLWSERRTGTPASQESGKGLEPGPVGDFAPGWVEMHFGDGCGAHSPQSPFGAYREVTLAALWRAARLGTMDKARLALVTSTDATCGRSQETPPRFVDELSLLEAPGVAAWFATNPNDHLLGRTPSSRPCPQESSTGQVVLSVKWSRSREPHEFVACCLSSRPVPSSIQRCAPKPHASYKTLDDPLKEFEDQSKMLSAEGYRSSTRARAGSVLCMDHTTLRRRQRHERLWEVLAPRAAGTSETRPDDAAR